MKKRLLAALSLASFAFAASALAEEKKKPLSPPGDAATQVGGKWNTSKEGRKSYDGGKWITVTYSRPIKRGRDVFGSGAEYGKAVNSDAPVWRAGANATTRLETEAALEMGGKKLAPGAYSVMIDLKEGAWTLIISSQPIQEKYDPKNKTALWGSYNYDPKFDVVRVPMKTSKQPTSVDQLTIGFTDMTDKGGKLTFWWDTTVASADFTVSGG